MRNAEISLCRLAVYPRACSPRDGWLALELRIGSQAALDLHSSILAYSRMQDPAPPVSHLVPALNPSVVQKGCLLQWCKAETAEDVGQPSHTSWDFVSYSPLPSVVFLLFPLSLELLPVTSRQAFCFHLQHGSFIPHVCDLQCDKMTTLTSKPSSSPTSPCSADIFLAS